MSVLDWLGNLASKVGTTGRRLSMLEVGDPAPDFEVTDHTDTTRRLSDYRGRHVVLWFYPKADTPG